MRAGMVIGLVGGILMLLVGIVVVFMLGAAGGLAGVLGESGAAIGAGVGAALALGLPIMTIVGGALARTSPKAAAILIGLPGIVVVILGISAGLEKGVLFLGLGAFLLIGVFLIWRDMRSSGAKTTDVEAS